MKRHFVLTMIVFIPTLVVAAPPDISQATTGPEVVAKKALVALKENRVDDFTKAMHPEALKGFRKMLAPLADAAVQEGEREEFLALFPGVSTVDELKKLDDRRFFTAFYQGFIANDPEMKQLMAGATMETLGHVMEGKDTAHVVCRMKMSFEGIILTQMSVISLQQTEGGWAMLLSGEVEGMANILKQQFQPEKQK